MTDKKGLGDRVESLIKTLLPSVYERKKDCKSCKKKKQFLNNFGGTIK